MIGAGALVLEGTVVPPDSLVLGFPAKVVRQVDETIRARSGARVDALCRKGPTSPGWGLSRVQVKKRWSGAGLRTFGGEREKTGLQLPVRRRK